MTGSGMTDSKMVPLSNRRAIDERSKLLNKQRFSGPDYQKAWKLYVFDLPGSSILSN
jgi:hypothetical protein